MLMRVRATLASASVVAALGLVIRSLTQVLHRLREAEAAGAAEAARADAEAARKHELACELLTLRNLLISTPASVETRFVPAPSDVFVVGYPRCGTTWVSQIVHALRTGAEVEKTMAFGEISEVVPWDVQAEACGQRLNSPQASVPLPAASSRPAASLLAAASLTPAASPRTPPLSLPARSPPAPAPLPVRRWACRGRSSRTRRGRQSQRRDSPRFPEIPRDSPRFHETWEEIAKAAAMHGPLCRVSLSPAHSAASLSLLPSLPRLSLSCPLCRVSLSPGRLSFSLPPPCCPHRPPAPPSSQGAISRLYLGCISAVSRLYLGYISVVPPSSQGARYIYVARDPVDAFLSCYEHLPAYANLPDLG